MYCVTLCSIIKSKKGSQLEYTLNSDWCKISFYTDKAHGEIILIANTILEGMNICILCSHTAHMMKQDMKIQQ